jgi:hypothetical protein
MIKTLIQSVHTVWAAIPPGVASLNGGNYRHAVPDINALLRGGFSRRIGLRGWKNAVRIRN